MERTHTLGFIFDDTMERVALIEKKRPQWQAGLYNGIGGKIEQGEASIDCIVREVHEECGLVTAPADWRHVGVIASSEWSVDVYAMRHGGAMEHIATTTDEVVAWHSIATLPTAALSNIPWLVHMAVDKLQNDSFRECAVYYP